MSKELNEENSKLEEEYCQYAKKNNISMRFTKTISRSFYEDSWSETQADFDKIVEFAKWYTSRSSKTLTEALGRLEELRIENDSLRRDARNVKSNLGWLKGHFFE